MNIFLFDGKRINLDLFYKIKLLMRLKGKPLLLRRAGGRGEGERGEAFLEGGSIFPFQVRCMLWQGHFWEGGGGFGKGINGGLSFIGEGMGW